MAAANKPPKAASATSDADEVEEQTDPSELEESRMPFLSHLAELRDRVRNAAIFFMLGFVVSWVFAKDIYQFIKQPLLAAWDTEKLGDFTMVFTGLTEPFWVELSIALWAGIFVSSPFIFYQLWRFIAPGLYKRERRIGVSFAIFSGIFFVGGAAFCWRFVLENLYDFLLDFATKEQKPMLAMQMYLDLTREMMLAFGAVFELPLLIYFLALVGLVTHRGLWKFNRWFVVIAFIIGAILTPTPDVVSQIMMAGPMIVLYNVSILLAWQVTRKRERADAALRAREAAADEAERQAREKRKAAQANAAGTPPSDDDI